MVWRGGMGGKHGRECLTRREHVPLREQLKGMADTWRFRATVGNADGKLGRSPSQEAMV